MQCGYNTTESTTDTFVKTSHIMTKLRAKLKERLNVLTTSTHKETTIRARKQHERMVQNLVMQLDKYFDHFLDGPARHMKIGVQINDDVVKGL
jgi:hypothetical protein